ncbi:MAG: hypothetical protein ABIG87_00990 [Patescibacteria group bacterium]
MLLKVEGNNSGLDRVVAPLARSNFFKICLGFAPLLAKTEGGRMIGEANLRLGTTTPVNWGSCSISG